MRRAPIWLSRILILALLVWLAAEGRQWWFRKRAERLLTDIKNLELNHSSWTDAQKLMTRWGTWGGWLDRCDANDCRYSIRIDDELFDAPDFVYLDGYHIGARLLDRIGLRTSVAVAGFHVVHGVVANKSFSMSVALPFRDWGVPNGAYWPSLDAEFREGATLLRDNPRLRATRPNHSFLQRRIRLEASFTPEESPEEQAALMDFQFNCITRWFPCEDRAQLLPKAELEYQAEIHTEQLEEDSGKRPPATCFPTVEIRAREETDIFIGDIIRSSLVRNLRSGDPNDMLWLIEMRPIQLLKGRLPGAIGTVVPVYQSQVTSGAPGLPRRVLITGTTGEGWGTHTPAFYAGDCGIVNASPENLAAAQQGMKEDFGPRI